MRAASRLSSRLRRHGPQVHGEAKEATRTVDNLGTLRRDLLNHVIVLNQHHLERLLRESVEEHYHVARPHQGLGGDTPIPTERVPAIDGPTKLTASPALGGLHHGYTRIAA
jgi:putative transposase